MNDLVAKRKSVVGWALGQYLPAAGHLEPEARPKLIMYIRECPRPEPQLRYMDCSVFATESFLG